MAPIKIVDVKKNYGSVPAVKGINLAVEDGEFIVLVGPSGCGKSTLLRMIAGLESITDGQVEIGGRNVNKAEPAERDIAMVFQNYALYPHMTVRGNLEYGLRTAARSARKSIVVSRRRPTSSKSGRCWTVSRANYLGDNASAWLWDGPSCVNRRRFFSTSLCPISMPSCASRCGSKYADCNAG